MKRAKPRDYLKNTSETRYRYRQSTKSERSAILDTYCELRGLSRKHASRVLRGKSKRKEKPKRRESDYQETRQAKDSLSETFRAWGINERAKRIS